MSQNRLEISYDNFPFHQLFTGPVKQLDTWLDQLMSAADPDDFNILIMKFNRKGKFVAVQFDHPSDLPLFVERHFLYENKHGRWAIMEYDRYWQLNKDMVRVACG